MSLYEQTGRGGGQAAGRGRAKPGRSTIIRMFEALRVPVVAAHRSVDGGWASRSSRDHAAGRKTRGVVLADLTWPQAEAILTVDAVVVTPLGAAAKEHGPHLRLDNDLRLAQYLAARVVEAS